MTTVRRSWPVATLLPATLLLVPTPAAQGQGWLNRVKDKVKTKVEQTTDQATDAAVDKAMGKAASLAKCVASDQGCIRNAMASGKRMQITSASGAPVSASDSASAVTAATGSVAMGGSAGASALAAGASASQPPGAGVWLNYDFVPGDKILFYEDFSGDRVGDLPARLDLTSGNAAVVDVNGTRYLRTVTGATAMITLPAPLPQRFTVEVTFHRAGGNGMGLYFRIGANGDDPKLSLRCDQGVAAIAGVGANGEKESGQQAAGIGENDFQTCRYTVDGGYVKAYVNNERVGQLNGLTIPRGNKIQMDVPNADDNGTLITGIRIAEGGKPLYDALAADGRVSTQGILFATGSATIQGESTPTLKEIGEMLRAHPDLKLEIDGHTDNVGSAAANQTLSEQRAAAVRQYLVTTYGIDASRLTSKGFGASRPVAPNDTPGGRQQNRRVELVRM